MKAVDSRYLGYSKCTYLLIIKPDEELEAEITGIKTAFAEKFDCSAARFSKPHITLMHFLQFEIMESQIVRKLHKFSEMAFPIDIDLQGFGSFPDHTIYLNIKTKEPLVEMVRKIRSEMQPLLKGDKEHKPHFATNPHITIARRLLPWQYEKGWMEWGSERFASTFTAGSMTLLKKITDAQPYEVVADFPFLSRTAAVQFTQGLLF